MISKDYLEYLGEFESIFETEKCEVVDILYWETQPHKNEMAPQCSLKAFHDCKELEGEVGPGVPILLRVIAQVSYYHHMVCTVITYCDKIRFFSILKFFKIQNFRI
jgi:hypothetical protein